MGDSTERLLKEVTKQLQDALPGRLQAVLKLGEQIDWQAPEKEQLSELFQLLHRLAGILGVAGHPAPGKLTANMANTLESWMQEDGISQAELDYFLEELAKLSEYADIDWRKTESLLESDRTIISLQKIMNPLIYLVDDDPDFSESLVRLLSATPYRVKVFHSLESLKQTIFGGEERPDLLLLDLDFPEGRIAGAEALIEINDELDVPLLSICLSQHDDINSRLSAMRAGMSRYVLKQSCSDVQKLCNILDGLTYRAENFPYHVLMVDDDELILSTYKVVLESAGMIVSTITNPLLVLDEIKAFNPDVLILDVYMPEASGPEIAAVIREKEELSWLPILFLSSDVDPSKHALALSHGGDDFLVKPVNYSFLKLAVKARAWRSRQLRKYLESYQSLKSTP